MLVPRGTDDPIAEPQADELGPSSRLLHVDQGLDELRRAVERARQGWGSTHEYTATAHLWAGAGLVEAGRLDEGIEQLERAQSIFVELGIRSPAEQSWQSFRLVDAYLARGDLEPAARIIASVLEAQDEAGYAADNEFRSIIRMLRGDLHAARGERAAAAVDYAAACDAFARTHDHDDPFLARCRFAHARVLGSGPQSRALAREAREAYHALGRGFAAERAEVSRCLAGRSRPRAPAPVADEPAAGSTPRSEADAATGA